MPYLHIDFETRSTLELEDVGFQVYAAHPDTDIWCMAYALDDDEPAVYPQVPDLDVRLLLADPTVLVVAHNAPFEMAIWNQIMVPRYGWPRLDVSRVRCTMAQGYAMGLPGKLDKMAAALGLTIQKDALGQRLALQMCRPRKDERAKNGTMSPTLYGSEFNGIVWWDEPDKIARLYEYCKQDVRVEREVHKRTLALSPEEQRLWCVDYAINETGVHIDMPAIQSALHVVAIEQERLAKELSALTQGAVNYPSQAVALTEWVNQQGVVCPSLQKTDVVDLLVQDIPPHVRRSLEIRQESARTSTAKLQKMQASCSTDGRLKHILQYHAAGTGRWGGRRIQPQNMPRPKLKQKEIEAILDFLPRYRPEHSVALLSAAYGSPMACISDCLRGVITATPGKLLFAGDYSNIEGRVLAWLADETWKIQAFRDYDTIIGEDDKGKPVRKGMDLYLLSAARIYHRSPTEFTKDSPERQIGKVAELACGYQGGVGAFQTMAYTYGVKVPDTEAAIIKTAWREANPKIQQYWWDLERAACEAVANPGVIVPAGPYHRVKFRVRGSFLFCLLPSGRMLCYPYPKLKPIETPWGEVKEQVHYKTVDDRTKQWVEVHTYGGKLAENVTQAVSRDLLAHSIMQVFNAGWKIVLHVHDEIVAESEDRNLEDFLALMRIQPPWSHGLPVAVEGWKGFRYRK